MKIITLMPWGVEVKTPWGWLVLTWRQQRSIYLSRNATPWGASWIVGQYHGFWHWAQKAKG